MQTERILVPIDLERCRPDVLAEVTRLVGRLGVSVILLHVLNVSRVTHDNCAYEKLEQQVRWHLEQLARRFLHPGVPSALHVRLGKPVEQILTEVEAGDVDLIVLPQSGKSYGKGMSSLTHHLRWGCFRGTSQRLLYLAPCPVLVLHAAECFNCGENSVSQATDVRSALQYLELISGARIPPELVPEDPFAEADSPCQLAA